MVKYIREYVIRDDNKLQIIIDHLYDSPKLRKYDYILDALIDMVDDDIAQCGREYSPSVWFSKFQSIINRFPFDTENLVLSPYGCWIDLFAEIYEANSGVDDEYENDKQHNKIVAEILNGVMKQIKEIITNDKTLQNDLFYSESESEVDITDNDWHLINDLVKKIGKYTLRCDTKFSDDEIRLIKKNMRKISFPLHRVESNNQYSFYNNGELREGDIINLKDGRANGIKSFTSNLNCDEIYNIVQLCWEASSNEPKVVLYETIGDVFAFGVDQISEYAKKVKNCQYEYFVSGEMEVTSIEKIDAYGKSKDGWKNPFGCSIIKICIKQIKK